MNVINSLTKTCNRTLHHWMMLPTPSPNFSLPWKKFHYNKKIYIYNFLQYLDLHNGQIFNFECCYAVCVSDQQGGPVVVEIRHFLLDERNLLSEEEECKHTWNTDARVHMCNFLKHVYQHELQEEQHQWTLTNSSCNQQFAQKQQEVCHSVQNCDPAVTESWISLIWHSTSVVSRSKNC